jgi:hypothetical protein
MFTLKVTHPCGDSREFPLEIFKSSIHVGGAWEPCASFYVPEEASLFLGSKHAGDTIVYAFHEGGVTQDSFEVWADDGTDETIGHIKWKLLIDHKPCTHEEFSAAAWNSMKTQTFRIPSSLDHKYRGCGNGIVKIEKSKGMVLDFDYTDEKLRPLDDQNISMCDDAGEIVREDDRTITYRANFSSYTICLY